MPPRVGPPNDPIAPRCHGTLPVSVCFRAPTLRRTLSMLLVLLLLLLFVELPGTWTARGGEWADRPTSSREPGTELSISSLFCPTAAYFLLESVFRSSEESVAVGSVPDVALTGSASLTSAVTYALTRCGSL